MAAASGSSRLTVTKKHSSKHKSVARADHARAGGKPARDDSSGATEGGGGKSRGGRRSPNGSWMRTHGRDLKFLAVFVFLMITYWGATTTSAVKEGFFPWYLEANAKASAGILHVFGYEDMHRDGKSLISQRGAITVERGCDAVEPTALFVSAVLASPIVLRSRLLAVGLGTVLLALLNLFRIITLFLCAVHWKAAFDIMHLDVWQTLFIVFAIVLWGVWAAWVTRKKRSIHADVGS